MKRPRPEPTPIPPPGRPIHPPEWFALRVVMVVVLAIGAVDAALCFYGICRAIAGMAR